MKIFVGGPFRIDWKTHGSDGTHVQQAGNASRTRSNGDIARSFHVHFHLPIFVSPPIVHVGGSVDNEVAASHGVLNCSHVGDVTDAFLEAEFRKAGEGRSGPAENPDLVTFLHHTLAQMGTEKPCGSSDQHPHFGGNPELQLQFLQALCAYARSNRLRPMSNNVRAERSETASAKCLAPMKSDPFRLSSFRMPPRLMIYRSKTCAPRSKTAPCPFVTFSFPIIASWLLFSEYSSLVAR